MNYLGDFRAGSTVRGIFALNAADGSRVDPSDALETADIRVYKGVSATQRTSESGYTIASTFDSLTGIVSWSVDTSDNTDAGFFAAGNDYFVVLYPSAETVDSLNVSAVVGHFSIENRSALMPTTVGRTLDVSTGGEAGIDWANVGSPTTTLNLSGTTVKTATDVETDTADIQSRLPAALVSGRMDASVGAIASGVDFSATMKASINTEADAALADVGVTTTVTGRIDAAITSRLASASYTAPLDAAGTRSAIGMASANLDTQIAALGAYLDTEIAAILEDTGTTIPAQIAALNNLSSAQAQTAAAAALSAYDPPTRTEATSDKDAIIAALPAAPDNASITAILEDTGTTIPAQITTRANSIDSAVADVPTVAEFEARTLAAAGYATASQASTIAGYLDTEIAAILAVANKIDTALELDGAVYRFTTNALEQAPAGGGGGVTAEDVVEALQESEVEPGGVTFLELQRFVGAILAGRLSGANASTGVVKALGRPDKTRVTMETDEHGNRLSVTLDGTD